MILVLSPAKRLNEHPLQGLDLPQTAPLFQKEIEPLLDIMKTKSASDLKSLMKISDKVAQLNVERFGQLQIPIPKVHSKPAVFLFNGDAFQGLDAATLSNEDLLFAQEHLRILSGLYGILRPLDYMMPYRLEMGTKLKANGFKNLYEYWTNILTSHLSKELAKEPVPALINVASKEYFSAIDTRQIDAPVYTMHFKEYRDGQYKFLTYYGKKARGLLVRFIVKNKLRHPEEIKLFDLDGYHFNPDLSTSSDWIFTRGD